MKYKVELEAIDTVEIEADTLEDAEDLAILEAEKYKPHWYAISAKETSNAGS
jgi:hypothetical protein